MKRELLNTKTIIYNEDGGRTETSVIKSCDKEIVTIFDKNNNRIYLKNVWGRELFQKYDENNLLIHSKDSTSETFYTRNDNGQLYSVKTICTDGRVKEVLYDNEILCNGKMKSIKNLNTGVETTYEYDDKRNLYHVSNTNGFEMWSEYDDHNNENHYKNSKGNEIWYEYDENNRVIHSHNNKYASDDYSYDDKGNVTIHIMTQLENNVTKYTFENTYDEQGRLIKVEKYKEE